MQRLRLRRPRRPTTTRSSSRRRPASPTRPSGTTHPSGTTRPSRSSATTRRRTNTGSRPRTIGPSRYSPGRRSIRAGGRDGARRPSNGRRCPVSRRVSASPVA